MINLRTRPISWYQPKLVVNRLGISLQWWWCWRGNGVPKWWVTLWFRPLRLRWKP